MTHVTLDSILLAEASHMDIPTFKGVGNYILNMCIEDDKTEYLLTALMITIQPYEGDIIYLFIYLFIYNNCYVYFIVNRRNKFSTLWSPTSVRNLGIILNLYFPLMYLSF